MAAPPTELLTVGYQNKTLADAGHSGLHTAEREVINALIRLLGSAMGAVTHGADATVDRPPFGIVTWFGSVAPNNMVDGDIWEQRP